MEKGKNGASSGERCRGERQSSGKGCACEMSVCCRFHFIIESLVAQMVKSLPSMMRLGRSLNTLLCHRRDLSLWPRKEVMKSQGEGECSPSLKQEEKCVGGTSATPAGKKEDKFQELGRQGSNKGCQSVLGFPGDASGKEPACQCRRRKRYRFDPWVGKIPRRRAWQPIPVFFAWRIPWTEEPGGLQFLGSHKVLHD